MRNIVRDGQLSNQTILRTILSSFCLQLAYSYARICGMQGVRVLGEQAHAKRNNHDGNYQYQCHHQLRQNRHQPDVPVVFRTQLAFCTELFYPCTHCSNPL
jgi:hypothetical protein